MTDTPSLDYSMPLSLSRDDGENSEAKKLEKRAIIVLTEGSSNGGREELNWGFLPGNVSPRFLPSFLPLYPPIPVLAL